MNLPAANEPPDPATGPGSAGAGRRRSLPWAAALVLALLAAWLTQRLLTEQSRARLLADQLALAEVALRSSQQQLEAERILAYRHAENLREQSTGAAPGAGLQLGVLTSALEAAPLAQAVAVWDPGRQEGLFRSEHLPPPGPGRDYQLWLSDPQYPDPVDAGVLAIGQTAAGGQLRFTARRPVLAVHGFAVTREPKGGAAKPGGPLVLSGK